MSKLLQLSELGANVQVGFFLRFVLDHLKVVKSTQYAVNTFIFILRKPSLFLSSQFFLLTRGF